MDLATIQIKVDTREVNSANDAVGKLGKTGTKVGKDLNAANDSLTKSTNSVSTAYKALEMKRKAVSIELNPDYFANGLFYIKAVLHKLHVPTLFDYSINKVT